MPRDTAKEPSVKALIRTIMMITIAASATTGAPAVTTTAAASASQTFTCAKAEIVSARSTSDGIVLTINKGSDDLIYVGSTGVIYSGNGTSFVADEDGDTVRFEIKTLAPKSSEAIVFQGDVDLDDL